MTKSTELLIGQSAPSKHYVNKETLRVELIKSNTRNELTRNAMEMLFLMIDNIQSSFKYINQADKEDCRSTAIEIILKKWKTYNILRKNPFAYFTRIIYNALFAGWNSLNKAKNKMVSISSIFQESV